RRLSAAPAGADVRAVRLADGEPDPDSQALGGAPGQPAQRRLLRRLRMRRLRLQEVARRLASVLADLAAIQAGVQAEGGAQVGRIGLAANSSVTAEETQRWNESHGKPLWVTRRQPTSAPCGQFEGFI